MTVLHIVISLVGRVGRQSSWKSITYAAQIFGENSEVKKLLIGLPDLYCLSVTQVWGNTSGSLYFSGN